MKTLLILVLFLLSACSVEYYREGAKSDKLIVVSKLVGKSSNLCDFEIAVPISPNIIIYDSCSCYDVGDTVDIVKVSKKVTP